jgi:hypothetical protein
MLVGSLDGPGGENRGGRRKGDLPLVDGWANPVVVFAGHDYFGDFECREVAQTQLDEFTPDNL